MKIALSIGHSPKDGGAETYDKKYSEYSFWKHHLPLLQEELQQMGHQAPIVNRFATILLNDGSKSIILVFGFLLFQLLKKFCASVLLKIILRFR